MQRHHGVDGHALGGLGAAGAAQDDRPRPPGCGLGGDVVRVRCRLHGPVDGCPGELVVAELTMRPDATVYSSASNVFAAARSSVVALSALAADSSPGVA